ncbi:MAG: geranylgeranylglycerol-phosphate geranylgeranyltransferase [Lutibacter sp.]|uniref:geranylgeranylglycerol-phosphate geranylgeranyltransferase n=1 Tax=Lutibacter sp. TaxID=1925666 RepID=UPI001835D800|nr:geranylgeranylglycerol-phosphate geranylgeranyltransferase [Lutibacter sp.]MBT8316226.1 geranylgeranylglycerol-phosphate geranylgeranyltransferase [Lutibacter sp.]NNJ57086.1 geranylgeranylglycerol-phosphate geranylgeranyltransferase [Lutibacter sp.]
MKIVAFFNLIRWKNLLLLLYSLLLLKFLLFSFLQISTNLSIFEFIVLLISIILITAAGYIINDILDVKSDLINKPNKVIVTNVFSIEQSKQLYLWINTLGLILGIGLSMHLQKPSFSFIFIGASLLLYYYSKKFKAVPLVGNITVSFLSALSIYIIYMIDIDTSIKVNTLQLAINIVFIYSFFAFLLSLIRELIKDIEDVNGDYNLQMNTLPILIGKKRTQQIITVICIILIILLIFILINIASIYKFTALYVLFFIIVPLGYCTFKIKSAESLKEFKNISSLLKIIMFLGISSVIIFILTS